MLLMLFAISLSANAQRLDSRDTSQLLDNTIFATQDTNLAGTYRWSQTPYSVLRDSIRSFDPDPDGALMAEKFRASRLFYTGDVPDVAASLDFGGRGSINSLFEGQMAVAKDYGVNGKSMAVFRDVGIDVRSENNNVDLSLSAKITDGSGLVSPISINMKRTRLNNTGLQERLKAGDIVGTLNFLGSSVSTRLGAIYVQVSDSMTATNHNTEMYFETVRNGSTAAQVSFKINDDGKWEGASYLDGWAKFENGVLEQKTHSEVLNELAGNAPQYADNTAAVTALGTGKAWRDLSGFLRVTY